jgi:hypothetical protein
MRVCLSSRIAGSGDLFERMINDKTVKNRMKIQILASNGNKSTQ